MQIIPLQAIPNQSLSVQLEDNTFDIAIHDCGDIISVTINVNNTPLITGQRAVNGFPILPYAYLEVNVGNFVFVSTNDSQDEYPDWRRFDTDLILVYASPAELEVLRASGT